MDHSLEDDRSRRIDTTLRSVKIEERTWFYTLDGDDAVLWRGNHDNGFDKRSCVEPEPRGHLDIPAILDGHRVVRIGSMAFLRCKGLTSVRIPEGVVELRGWGCFYGCRDLESIEIPESLARIDAGSSVFDQCSALKAIDLKQCKFIAGCAFQGCRHLRSVFVSSDNESYVSKDGILYSKDMSTLIVYPKELSSFSIPRSVSTIGPHACNSCGFSGRIVVSAHVVKMERHAFHLCTADEIVLSNVDSLPDGAFYGCDKLRKVVVPESVREIGHSIFSYALKLETVVFAGAAPHSTSVSGRTVFGEQVNDFTIYVPEGAKGWNPDGDGLPDRWPVGAGENARKIRYVDGAEHAGEPASRQGLKMSAPAKELKWLVGEDRPQPVPPVRICFDQSHGGGINENGAFYLPILSNEKGFSHKPCWYGFDKENLSHVNVVVLPLSHNNIPYLQTEREALRTFMEKGGTVVSIVDGSDCNMSISKVLLSEYGLAVVSRGQARDDADILKAKGSCPALEDIHNIDYVQSTVAEVQTEKDAAVWSALVAAADGAPLVACRPVGKGHLVYASAGLCFSKERMRDHASTCRMWKRLFFSAAKEKRISPKADLYVRDVLAAPCKLPVGPITLHYADRWEKDVKMIAGHVQKSLIALKQMGVPDITTEQVNFSNVALLGTGNMHWYWTGGKRQMVGILWGGSPEYPGALVANLVENILNGPLCVPEDIPLRRYLGLMCLQKIGLESEFARLMPRAESTDTQDQFCRAFEAIRKDCLKFPNAFVEEWSRAPEGTPSPTFFDTLTRAIGRDCRPYFTREGVAAFGLGKDAAEQDAWQGKLAFSDREIAKMKGLQSDKAAQRAFDRLFPGWKVSGCVGVADEGWNRVGYVPELNGRRNLCCTLPRDSRKPVKFKKVVTVTQDDPKLFYSIRKTPYADAGFRLEILVDGKVVNERRVDDGDWVDESFDLSTWKGKKIQLEIRQSKLPDLKNARATWSRLEVN